jgi:hypothetical protein
VTSGPILSTPRLGAIAVGALCLGVFCMLFSWAIESRVSAVLVTTLFWAMFVVPGLVVGLIARVSPVMHGLILGLLVVLVFPLAEMPWREVLSLLSSLMMRRPDQALDMTRGMGYWALFGVVMCPLGAIFGSYVAQRIRRT